MAYRREPGYQIPDDFEFPECPSCGAQWMTGEQNKTLSRALEAQRAERIVAWHATEAKRTRRRRLKTETTIPVDDGSVWYQLADARRAGYGTDRGDPKLECTSEFRRGYEDGYFERSCQPTSRHYVEGYERGRVMGRVLR
jgi:hypothetical protein